jgi:RNA recognition motif-containing protein
MNIYVGNLSYKAEEKHLLEIFGQFGEVSTVKIVSDRETGRSKGFGFVEMPDDDEAYQAISQLNQTLVMGRPIVVNEAKPREKRPSSFGGGGGNRYKNNDY